MPGLLERVSKLKSASLDELRLRCAQAARARLERIGLGWDSRVPTDRGFAQVLRSANPGQVANSDHLLEIFRERAGNALELLPGLTNPESAARELARRWPETAADIISSAERLASGELELGGRRTAIASPPDWMVEPRSGTRVPAVHWSRLAVLEPRVTGDCRLLWELNRHQYFVTLAHAYQLTGDDRYPRIILQHMSSWMDVNPPKIGINWASSLEVAFRAISWIWALYLVRDSRSLDGPTFLRLLKFLYLHARHIEDNLSTYSSPNTHLTGEALGLLYIGAAVPELTRAAHWRALGARILAEQLERQLLADGVYFEHSTYYHRYTTDFCLHALLLARGAESWLAAAIRPKLNLLLDYLLDITRPDGTSPLIGDDDGGRLVLLGQRAPNDFRDTLAIGAAILQRSDCAFAAGHSVQELIWLLGPAGLRQYESLTIAPPAHESRAFAFSGYYVMRESWGPGADWGLVRCGPPAAAPGTHAHADALSLELSVAGRPVLIDPGTYIYTAAPDEREYFRASAAHNTMTVDDRSSAEPGYSVFKWSSVPQSRATAWISDEIFDFFEGEHDGYRRLDPPALHSRAIFFLKGEYWVICDRVRSTGPHRLALHFHWAPGVRLGTEGDDTLTVFVSDASTPDARARVFARTGRLTCEQGWVSPGYGARTRAPASVFRLESADTEEVVTLAARSTAPLRLQECSWRTRSDRRAGVLDIPMVSGKDTILTGPTLTGDGGDVVSDAAWTWVRRSREGTVMAFALIHGRTLIVDKRRQFQADHIVDYATGRRGPDGWRIGVRSSSDRAQRSVSSMNNGVQESCAASVE